MPRPTLQSRNPEFRLTSKSTFPILMYIWQQASTTWKPTKPAPSKFPSIHSKRNLSQSKRIRVPVPSVLRRITPQKRTMKLGPAAAYSPQGTVRRGENSKCVQKVRQKRLKSQCIPLKCALKVHVINGMSEKPLSSPL